MVNLVGYKINKLEIENTAQIEGQFQLDNQLSYSINYVDDGKTCIANLKYRLYDKQLRPFNIELDMVARFTYDPGDEKPDIHTQSFDQLFPFLRQIVHINANFAGVPNLMVPTIKLDRNSVQYANNPPEEKENSPLN